jgi:hypothetical protein
MLLNQDQKQGQSHPLGVEAPRLCFEVLVLQGLVRISCYEHLGDHATCLTASAVRLAVHILVCVSYKFFDITYCAQSVDQIGSSRISIAIFFLDRSVFDVKFELGRGITLVLRPDLD